MRATVISIFRKRKILAFAGVCAVFIVCILAAQAQKQVVSAAPASGITVSPVNLTLDLAKTDQSQDGTVTVRNDYASSVSFNASIHGMQVLAGGSLAPTDNPEPAISAALSVTPSSFTLDPGQSTNLRLHLINSSELSPGGHYVSLLIKQADTTSQKLTLSPAVSVAIFVIREDGAIRATKVSDISTNGWLLRLPSTATVSFSGTGNVAVVPRATISVVDPRGHMIMTGVVNDDSIPVWPKNTVKLQSQLRMVAFSWLPGRYKVQALYRYDGSDTQQMATRSYWMLPPAFIYGFIGVCIVSFGAFRLYLLLRPRLSRKRKFNGQPTKLASTTHRPAKAVDVIVRKRSSRPKPRDVER